MYGIKTLDYTSMDMQEVASIVSLQFVGGLAVVDVIAPFTALTVVGEHDGGNSVGINLRPGDVVHLKRLTTTSGGRLILTFQPYPNEKPIELIAFIHEAVDKLQVGIVTLEEAINQRFWDKHGRLPGESNRQLRTHSASETRPLIWQKVKDDALEPSEELMLAMMGKSAQAEEGEF